MKFAARYNRQQVRSKAAARPPYVSKSREPHLRRRRGRGCGRRRLHVGHQQAGGWLSAHRAGSLQAAAAYPASAALCGAALQHVGYACPFTHNCTTAPTSTNDGCGRVFTSSTERAHRVAWHRIASCSVPTSGIAPSGFCWTLPRVSVCAVANTSSPPRSSRVRRFAALCASTCSSSSSLQRSVSSALMVSLQRRWNHRRPTVASGAPHSNPQVVATSRQQSVTDRLSDGARPCLALRPVRGTGLTMRSYRPCQ